MAEKDPALRIELISSDKEVAEVPYIGASSHVVGRSDYTVQPSGEDSEPCKADVVLHGLPSPREVRGTSIRLDRLSLEIGRELSPEQIELCIEGLFNLSNNLNLQGT